MRIYLAARFDRGDEMRDVAAALARAGHFVTSRWVHGRQNAPDLVSAVEYQPEGQQPVPPGQQGAPGSTTQESHRNSWPRGCMGSSRSL